MNFKQAAKLAIVLLSFCLLSCSKESPSKENVLNSRLDSLEMIISSYEPKFNSIEYGSKEYADMVVKYNEDIFSWAEKFEAERYEKDSNGKVVQKKEFSEVEKRFYDLNNRMTQMVLRNIPKKEEPLPQPEPIAEQPK